MRILLADDDAVTRHLMGQVLRKDGHEVTAVADGRAAVEAHAADPFPLLVVDWQMPELDGLAVCRRIRAMERGGTAFLLMLTGRDSADDVAAALAAGVDDYLVKPASPEHVRLRLVIAERRIALDEARREMERELAEVRWKAGVGEAVTALQHEINNPLAALSAVLELAVYPDASPEEQGAALEQALAQTRRIADVVRRISAIRSHQSVEYVEGVRMIAVPPGSRALPEG